MASLQQRTSLSGRGVGPADFTAFPIAYPVLGDGGRTFDFTRRFRSSRDSCSWAGRRTVDLMAVSI